MDNRLKQWYNEIVIAQNITSNFKYFLILYLNILLFHFANHFKKLKKFSKIRKLKLYHNNSSYVVYFRSFSADVWSLIEIFGKEIYSLPKNDFHPKFIVDLGANIGLAAKYFKLHYPQAKVICVEPSNENFTMLNKNLEKEPNIKLYNNAIDCMQRKLYLKSNSEFNQISVTSSLIKNAETVDTITMDEILKNEEFIVIDLLKIDIEGYEEILLTTSNDWLKYVKEIIIEIHPTIVDYKKIVNELEVKGFTFYNAGTYALADTFRNKLYYNID